MEHDNTPLENESHLSLRMMSLIANKGKEQTPPEVWERFETQQKEMLQQPVVETPTVEAPREVAISPEDLADAAKILGEEQKMALPENETPGFVDGEVRDLRWDENLDRDLNLAAREPRRWKDPADHSKGPLPNDERAGYQQKINEATARLGTRGYDVHILKDRDGRKRVAGARRIVFGGMDSATIGMKTEEAEQILDGMNIDVKRAREGGEKRRAEPRPTAAAGEGLGRVETRSVTEMFTAEEKAKIVKKAYDSIFIEGAYGAQQVVSSFFGDVGFLRTQLFKSKDENGEMARAVQEILEPLGLDNWIAVRENVKTWNGLANKEEVVSSVLTENLFLPDDVEKFFVLDPRSSDRKRRCSIPEVGADGKLRTVEVDMEASISDAMKRIKGFFEGSWAPDPINPSGTGRPGTGEKNEYWGYVGSSEAERARLYQSLGINKYVAEVAFSVLLSHNMLTETSSDDIFLMMVDSAVKRPGNYRINEARDPFVRMFVQSELAAGRSVPSKDQMTAWMAQHLPRHMIPTGLTGEGREALESGNWMNWRVQENMFSFSERVTAVAEGRTVKIATDPAARLLMMRDALDILLAIKDVANPQTDLDKLEKLMSTILKWGRADLAAVGYATLTGGTPPKKIIDSEFCLADGNGSTVDTESFDWGGKMMASLAEMFLYTHSILDAENNNPWDFDVFSEKAKEIMRLEAQSEKGTYIGLSLDSGRKRTEISDYIRKVDRFWRDMKAFAKPAGAFAQTMGALFSVRDTTILKHPSWYKSRVPLSPEKLKILRSGADSDAWPELKRRMGL